MSTSTEFKQYMERCRRNGPFRDLVRVNVEILKEAKVLSIKSEYMSWSEYTYHTHAAIARDCDVPRTKKRDDDMWKMSYALAGRERAYDAVTRKMLFEEMVKRLSVELPRLDKNTVGCIAGVLVNNARKRGRCAHIELHEDWHREMVLEVLRYRRSPVPAAGIRNKEDLTNYLLRNVNNQKLSCRRKVTAFILSGRYYTQGYDSPEFIRALDASFRFTNSAYAFRLAQAARVTIDLVVPDAFYKQAGNKARSRKYKGWLANNTNTFVDIFDSLQHEPTEELAKIRSWSALAEHSRAWHAEQMAFANKMNKQADGPFEIDPGVPRKANQGHYTFELIETPQALAAEASSMRHCVASYAPLIRAFEYMAFTVCGDKERATLGIIADKGNWQLNQVRGKFNAEASSMLEAACVSFVATLPSPPKRRFVSTGFIDDIPF